MFKKLVEGLTKEQKVKLYERDIYPQVVSAWKNDRRRPTYAQCVTLAEITGADLPRLLTEVALKDATPEQQEMFKHYL